MRNHLTLGVLAAGLVLGADPAWAVELEDGPAFFTDSHGAAGVVMAMLSMADEDPKYLECAEQTLAWLVHVGQRDARGRVAWVLSQSAPEGHRNRRIALPGQPLVILMFFDAFEKTGKKEYRQVGLAAARWLAEVGADRRATPAGTAYGWGWAAGQKDAGLVAGYSHGLGKYLDVFRRAHRLEPHPAFRDALVGILVRLKTSATDLGEGCTAFPSFPFRGGGEPNAIRTGYCYGQAGVIIPLMKLTVDMPDLKLDDGTTPLKLGNGSLKYLMREARPRLGGYVWPYMRHDRESKNPGLGSGTGGIGLALLEGYRANLQRGDRSFARECMKYARGAAEYALALVERAPDKGVMIGGGGAAGFGVCGGAGATAWLPMLLAKELGDDEPEFRARVERATRKVTRLVIGRATPVGETLAWTLTPGERERFEVGTGSDVAAVNMSLDYGQTGVVLELAEMGGYLEDKEVLAAARKAADFVIDQAVKTDEGWKFARFVRVGR